MQGSKPRDIEERTFRFAVEIVNLCRRLDRRSGVDRTLARQLLRSATSVGANVQEAQAAQSRADFVSKYSIALKEARETAYWLRLLNADREAASEPMSALRQEATEISRILGAIVAKANVGAPRYFFLVP